jgi:signal transduction histidine kinase
MSPSSIKIIDSNAGSGSEYSRMAREVRRSHDEMDHLVRALSHDMSAHFMLLENSVARLASSLDELSQEDLEQNVTHVEACLRESKRFVNDLVDLAKTGQVEMDSGRVNIAAVIDEVLFEQADLIRERNVAIEVSNPLPVVWCNEHRAKQVVTNLLRNAIKHGCDEDHPRITIFTVHGEDSVPDGEFATLRFHDNGPGIEPAFHESVFLPGRRLANANSDGSGMGLAIIRKIVEHYGGFVRIDPSCPSGTALLVTLPVKPLDNRSDPQPHDASGKSPQRSLGHDAAHPDRHLKPHQSIRGEASRHGR